MPFENEKIYAPIGNYSLGFNNKGELTFVPTINAQVYSDIHPEEYTTPEYYIYPHTVKMLIGPDGKPAASREAVEAINEEKHRPLNPYTAYL